MNVTRARGGLQALGIIASLVIAGPAAAQSKRYPPPPPDPDREAAAHSSLWDGALDPGRMPYEAMVADAKRLADEHIADATAEALEELGRAIARFPKAPDAFWLRGHLELQAKNWVPCATDLEAADDRRRDEGAERIALQYDLGICAARAGRYAVAERALARAAASGETKPEPWLRLGEVRIAMGKLEEATAALDAALETGDGPQGLMHFLLAAAYDRERRPGDAEEQVRIASDYDHAFSSLESPTYPLLGEGEHEYLLGLAYRYANLGHPHLEFALVYFKRFLAVAPDSPWRRRAEDHIRELGALEFPQTVEPHAGTARLDVDVARGALVKVMPAMRACLAKTPTAVFEVEVTRDGPHAPVARDRPTFRVPASGTKARDILSLDNSPHAELDAAGACIQAVADRAAMPTPKAPDTYYTATFLVVAP